MVSQVDATHHTSLDAAIVDHGCGVEVEAAKANANTNIHATIVEDFISAWVPHLQAAYNDENVDLDGVVTALKQAADHLSQPDQMALWRALKPVRGLFYRA